MVLFFILVHQVIRREAEKHCSADELQDGGVQAEVGAYPMKRKVVSKPVDEDLYKVPQPLLYRKPKKVRTIYRNTVNKAICPKYYFMK